jgi:A/G-specific adenine glycosylase
MLQQTQVQRVLKKYETFLELFPDFNSLASSPLSDVLRAWDGLGYVKRAAALKRIAETTVRDFGGTLPDSRDILLTFPSIGEATSSSILAFAFDKPSVFIETNIRAVFIHFFFPGSATVADSQIMPLIEATLDRKHPRKWYYALMDYGADLKKRYPKLLYRSSHYKKQSRFHGSSRELRSKALKYGIDKKRVSRTQLRKAIACEPGRLAESLESLEKDGLIVSKNGFFKVKKT